MEDLHDFDEFYAGYELIVESDKNKYKVTAYRYRKVIFETEYYNTPRIAIIVAEDKIDLMEKIRHENLNRL